MHWTNFRVRVLCLGMFAVWGCHSKDHETRQVVEEWCGKQITFPTGLKASVSGRDTTAAITDLLKKDYCVLTFFDSTGCTECNMQLYDWHLRMKDISGLEKKVDFIFVVHAQNFAAVSAYAVKNKFKHLLFYDTDRALWKANKNLPGRPDLHTFLLDREHNVILIGNPARNNTLWELYKTEIGKKEK